MPANIPAWLDLTTDLSNVREEVDQWVNASPSEDDIDAAAAGLKQALADVTACREIYFWLKSNPQTCRVGGAK